MVQDRLVPLQPSPKLFLFAAEDLAICVTTSKSNLCNVRGIDRIIFTVEDWCNDNLLCLNLKSSGSEGCLVNGRSKKTVKFLCFFLYLKFNCVFRIDNLSCKLSKGKLFAWVH